MPDKPKILNSSLISKTRIFRIEELELEFSNGTKVHYERLKGAAHGSVIVIPMRDDNTVLMIKEYAAGTHRYELALPKGRIEKQEDRLKAANRELMEEIGYGAKRLTHLCSLSIAPGYIASCTDVVLAQDLYRRRLKGDEPEEIEVVPWRLDRLHKLLDREDFSEARSIAAMYIARDFLANQRDS